MLRGHERMQDRTYECAVGLGSVVSPPSLGMRWRHRLSVSSLSSLSSAMGKTH